MTSHIEPVAHLTANHVALAATALERLGWDLLSCEVDLVHETFRLEVRCGALHVTLDARNGRVLLEREVVRQRQACNVRHTHGQIWDRELLGRRRPEGLRSGLLLLANYIRDNGAPQIEARAAMIILLTAEAKP